MDIQKLGNGVDGVFVKNDRFNTTVVSFNFYVPLSFSNIPENSLLIYVLSSCSEKYQTFAKLNFELSMLYGASLNASVSKVGDAQLVKLAVSVINDRYSLDGSSVVSAAVKLLESLIFEPRISGKNFFEEDVAREKRKINELIAAEINDKRLFARKRLIEEAFKNKPFGMPALGTVDGINSVTAEKLYNAWERLLKTAYIRVNVIGKALPEGIFEDLNLKFKDIERNVDYGFKNCETLSENKTVNYLSDELEVAQGKLVMGFSSEISGGEAYELSVACDIFGGGPYSKLFENVREKMSLCYYCSARPVLNKGFVYVDSGVERENCDKAQKAILEQLESVKKGDFSDFTLQASLKSIVCGLASYNDNLIALDSWYSAKIFSDYILSPEEAIEKVKKITREDVIRAINGVKLHTVYKIVPLVSGGDTK